MNRFRVAVRPGTTGRAFDDVDTFGGEDGVEGVGELGVPVADQEAKRVDLVIEIHQQGAGGLGGPGRGRMGGHPEEMNLPGAHLDDEQDGETAQSDGVEGEKVGGHKPGGLGAGGRSAIRCRLGVVPGRAEQRGRIGRMVPVPTRWASPASSPWIRRWPQEGFSWARRCTSVQISPVIGGRPDRWG